MMWAARGFISTLVVAAAAAADDPVGSLGINFDTITRPTTGDVLTAGSTFEVTWTIADHPPYPADTVSIFLTVREDIPTGAFGYMGGIAAGIINSGKRYPWTVDTLLNTSLVYQLSFANEQRAIYVITSNEFRIAPPVAGIRPATSSTLTLPNTPSTSAETKSSVPAPARTTATSSTAPTPSANSSTSAVSSTTPAAPVGSPGTSAAGGLSTGAKAGISVGAVLGAILLIAAGAAGAVFFMRRRMATRHTL